MINKYYLNELELIIFINLMTDKKTKRMLIKNRDRFLEMIRRRYKQATDAQIKRGRAKLEQLFFNPM